MSRPRLFLDSSALFAGVVSESGVARVRLQLAEAGSIGLIVSEQVVAETERAIARKAPRAIVDYRSALRSVGLQIFPDPPREVVEANQDLISDPTDVPIVLAAMNAGVDYLVTLNRRHFIDDPLVAQRSALQIGTPGDALAWLRALWVDAL